MKGFNSIKERLVVTGVVTLVAAIFSLPVIGISLLSGKALGLIVNKVLEKY